MARVGEILKAATTARWPMYLRNVKQLLRAADGGFDERRYGFAGLVELVRGCQKEGLVRLERDRRGGLRVFPGPSLQRSRRRGRKRRKQPTARSTPAPTRRRNCPTSRASRRTRATADSSRVPFDDSHRADRSRRRNPSMRT